MSGPSQIRSQLSVDDQCDRFWEKRALHCISAFTGEGEAAMGFQAIS